MNYMKIHRLIEELQAELDSLYAAPKTEETKTRIGELEEELDSLYWELDARIY